MPKNGQVGRNKREASVAKLLSAAQKLFMEKGYEKTTMQDVVREAGSSIGNLYFNFANKEELLQQLVEDELAAAHAWSDEIMLRVPPGPGRLATMIFSTAKRILDHGAPIGRLLRGAGGTPVGHRVEALNSERVRGYIAENLPDLTPLEARYAHIVWSAGGVAMSQEIALRVDSADIWPAVEFFARWNLRAMRVSEGEIDRAIEIAYGAVL